VKEQAAGTYAQAMAERGYAALTFDYRYFGESGDRPRQFEDPGANIEDIKNAATALLADDRLSELPLFGLGIGFGVVHSEQARTPDLAHAFYAAVHTPKEELWLRSHGQIDFYDDPQLIAPATDAVAAYLRRRAEPLHLRAWLESDEHAAWLVRAEPHVLGPMRTSFVTGLETWFTLPGQPGAPPPSPYKMALLTGITIFPLITAIVAVTGPLLESLPVAVRLGITTALTVPLMTWVVMPRVTRLLRGWLYPGR
jgi:antibiotic biosynthesis monooxygenase (ABM) superfamily enzyme